MYSNSASVLWDDCNCILTDVPLYVRIGGSVIIMVTLVKCSNLVIK